MSTGGVGRYCLVGLTNTYPASTYQFSELESINHDILLNVILNWSVSHISDLFSSSKIISVYSNAKYVINCSDYMYGYTLLSLQSHVWREG